MSKKTKGEDKATPAAVVNSNAVSGLKEEDLDQIVFAYLQRKGYSNAQEALKNDSTHVASITEVGFQSLVEADTSVAHQVLFFNAADNKPSTYDESYSELKKWIAESLELYKVELSQVLYPLFVHCYLDLVARGYPEDARQFLLKHRASFDAHESEIIRLSGITLPEHLRENELALTYRQNKKNLEMCSATFGLFISFLQDRKFMLLLSLANQYCNIRVFAGKPQEEEETLAARTALTGERVEDMSGINAKKVWWGMLDEHPQVTARLEAQSEDLLKKKKKVKVAEGKDAAKAGSAPPRERIPLPDLSEEEVQARLQVLAEARQAVRLGPASLPSICMYTFLNTRNNVNSVAFSDDARLAATGQSDSLVRVWSLSGDKLRTMKGGDALEELEHDEHITPEDLYDDATAADSKTLTGHCGPVYGTAFSPDKRFLLSASEDSTVRLWSLQTYTNLVCYKGHNYPVWDVDFSPVGFYFATASHDRTARLWSTDVIYPLRVFAGHLGDVDAVKFHPNSNYVATGSSDKTCRLWDALKGDCVRLLTGHTGAVQALAMSPCGRYLASGGEDRNVLVWDLGSGRKIGALHGHEGMVYSLAFSADSSVLASGAADNTVRLWDVKALGGSGRSANLQLGAFPTKATPVTSVRFTRQNLLLAAGCFNPS